MGKGGVIADTVWNGRRQNVAVTIFVLQTLAVQCRAAGSATQQETTRLHIARSPGQIAHTLEAKHGVVNVEAAIAQSCDVYFYEAIQKVRLDNLEKRSMDFYHGVPTDIDLPSEMKGKVPNRKYMNKLYGRYGWSTGAMLNISIGQGEVLVTPIQMAAYTNILATRGIPKNLHLVNPKINQNVKPLSVSSKTWDIIHDSMKEVVNGKKGTGKLSNPNISGVLVSGKTGTAENPHGETHAWYIGFADYHNKDMISVVILVENGGGGGSIASPIARKIFKKYNERVNVNLARSQ